MLLALDPGMGSPGIALFVGEQLSMAGHVKAPAHYLEMEAGLRWLVVANDIEDFIRGSNHVVHEITQIVFEKPQWYPQSKSKVDPNQLAGIAGVAAMLVGRISRYWNRHQFDVFSPTPREWIGQVSKVCPACNGKAKKKCVECHGSAWETPRGRLIRSRLSPPELTLVPDQNDAIDAVGLGLFRLGRLTPRRVFSNGTD